MKIRHSNGKCTKAFTLIELILVMTILAIAVSITAPALANFFRGRTLEQEIGNGWAEGVHTEDLNRCIEIYESHFDARREFTLEYRLRRQNGDYGWVQDHGVPRFAPGGEFLGYVGTASDVTELKQAEERWRAITSARERRNLTGRGYPRSDMRSTYSRRAFSS